jgi:hypothetical protein
MKKRSSTDPGCGPHRGPLGSRTGNLPSVWARGFVLSDIIGSFLTTQGTEVTFLDEIHLYLLLEGTVPEQGTSHFSANRL